MTQISKTCSNMYSTFKKNFNQTSTQFNKTIAPYKKSAYDFTQNRIINKNSFCGKAIRYGIEGSIRISQIAGPILILSASYLGDPKDFSPKTTLLVTTSLVFTLPICVFTCIHAAIKGNQERNKILWK